MPEKIIHARALPESIRLTETYCYDQEISRNPSTRAAQTPPAGRIEVIVPYDGDQCFTRKARDDVEHQLGGDAARSRADALIGYLALDNYKRTNLKQLLHLSDHYGSIPLRVPVIGDGIANLDQLCSDRQACIIAFDYVPDAPDVTPVGIDMSLSDEDILDPSRVELLAEEAGEQLAKIEMRITQQVNFLRYLLLSARVRLDLPRRLGSVKPKIVRMSLGWPTITSLRSLHLFVEDGEANDSDQETPITYNPLTRSVEWGDITMEADEKSSGTGLQTYFSKPMDLWIDQPGELYQQNSLEGQVEIEIPDRLLSSLHTRLYNGVGAQAPLPRPELTTRLNVKLHLILDDAFMRRPLSPYQQLHFDEVIPDRMRVADIKAALADRGFRIQPQMVQFISDDKVLHVSPDLELSHTSDELKHFIFAQRSIGLDTMQLWILVEGRRYATQRQTRAPDQTITRPSESGDLNVYVRGELPGNGRGLIQEMNAFHEALRDRFERVRSKG